MKLDRGSPIQGYGPEKKFVADLFDVSFHYLLERLSSFHNINSFYELHELHQLHELHELHQLYELYEVYALYVLHDICMN